MSNHEPTGKWNVAGCYVTCISNCVLGNSGLNAIDSWGVRHYAALQTTCLQKKPFQPHGRLSDTRRKTAPNYCAINISHNHRPEGAVAVQY